MYTHSLKGIYSEICRKKAVFIDLVDLIDQYSLGGGGGGRGATSDFVHLGGGE
jgi:hypothetical protein